MPAYLLTVPPGLERVAGDELAAKLPGATVRETERGRIVVEASASDSDLLALRTVDNVYVFLGEVRIGPHRADLPALGRCAADLLDAHAAQRPVTLWVNASRRGPHSYSRFEAADAVAGAVLHRRPRWRLGTPAEHSVELRLDLDGERAWLSRRLSPPELRWRGRERAFAAAALRPPTAHALVWLTAPSAQDVFLDPFCGSGTIVLERAAYDAQRIVGSDVAADAIASARENAGGARLELHQWDARSLPLDARSVDAVATNLPFGRQVLDAAALPGLYLDWARELQRILAPGGVAIALTERPDVLLHAVQRTRLRAEQVLTLSLKGLRPEIVRLGLG
ncbi:MAG TPA: methyltransferase domain-containing protein [Chloroflexota bacterium]|nr:methyltransferase domain-containing protein [Chloroflexota bacterium]